MAVTIEDIVGAAASSVLRALDARRAGAKGAVTETEDLSTAALVRSGFHVDFRIICGGPRVPPWELSAGNPTGQTKE
jgi:hypothetical protein